MVKFIASYGTQTTTFTVTDRGPESLQISTLMPKIERQWGTSLAGTEVRIAGALVGADHAVTDGARLEFVKPCGSKA